jgi:hypothetical protein
MSHNKRVKKIFVIVKMTFVVIFAFNGILTAIYCERYRRVLAKSDIVRGYP